jgi:hypothetical protein
VGLCYCISGSIRESPRLVDPIAEAEITAEWRFSLVILLHRPRIVEDFTMEAGRDNGTSKENMEISLSSAKTILDILTFAELVSPARIVQFTA